MAVAAESDLLRALREHRDHRAIHHLHPERQKRADGGRGFFIGLPDAWELQYYPNINSYNATNDIDKDGANNLAEWAFNLNPTRPDIAALTPGTGTAADRERRESAPDHRVRPPQKRGDDLHRAVRRLARRKVTEPRCVSGGGWLFTAEPRQAERNPPRNREQPRGLRGDSRVV